MSSARCSTLVLIAGAFLIVRPVVAAQWIPTVYFTTFAPANDVSFTISTDRESYGSDDTISMKYEIANVSGRPVFVPQTTEKLMCPPRDPCRQHGSRAPTDTTVAVGSGGGGSCGKRIQIHDATHEQRRGLAEARRTHVEGTLPLSAKRLPPGGYRIEPFVGLEARGVLACRAGGVGNDGRSVPAR